MISASSERFNFAITALAASSISAISMACILPLLSITTAMEIGLETSPTVELVGWPISVRPSRMVKSAADKPSTGKLL